MGGEGEGENWGCASSTGHVISGHNDCQSSGRATPKMLTHLLSFFGPRRRRRRRQGGQRGEWKPHYTRKVGQVLWLSSIPVIVVVVIARSASSTDDKSLQFIYVPFRSKIFVRFLWLGGIPRQPELSTFLRFPFLL